MVSLRSECVSTQFWTLSRYLTALKVHTELLRRLKLLWCGLLLRRLQTSGLISGCVIGFCGGGSLP